MESPIASRTRSKKLKMIEVEDIKEDINLVDSETEIQLMNLVEANRDTCEYFARNLDDASDDYVMVPRLFDFADTLESFLSVRKSFAIDSRNERQSSTITALCTVANALHDYRDMYPFIMSFVTRSIYLDILFKNHKFILNSSEPIFALSRRIIFLRNNENNLVKETIKNVLELCNSDFKKYEKQIKFMLIS